MSLFVVKSRIDLHIQAGKTGKEALGMIRFQRIEHTERPWRQKEPVTNPSLKGVQWMLLLVLIFIGSKVGWWNLVGVLFAVGCFKLVGLLWRERDFLRSATPLFFGNYAAREAAEEEERRIFGSTDDWSMVQPKTPSVTEAEIADINVVGAPILPLHGSAEDDPIVDFYGTYTAPPPARWRVFLRDVWFWLTKSRR